MLATHYRVLRSGWLVLRIQANMTRASYFYVFALSALFPPSLKLDSQQANRWS